MENTGKSPTYRHRTKAWDWSELALRSALFFLAMDTGRTLERWGEDDLFAIITIGVFIVLPYFLPIPFEKPRFGGWIIIQLSIAAAGLVTGRILNVISELLLMENLRFVPMTFLIITGILCAGTQIRGIIRVRLAS
jgi:hypothetical protein